MKKKVIVFLCVGLWFSSTMSIENKLFLTLGIGITCLCGYKIYSALEELINFEPTRTQVYQRLNDTIIHRENDRYIQELKEDLKSERLIEKINEVTTFYDNFTLLMQAAREGSHRTIPLLIESGADHTLKYHWGLFFSDYLNRNNGKTAYDLAKEAFLNPDSDIPLEQRHRYFRCMLRLIEPLNSEEQKKKKQELLELAAITGCYAWVDYMLNHRGANPHIKNKSGTRIYHKIQDELNFVNKGLGEVVDEQERNLLNHKRRAYALVLSEFDKYNAKKTAVLSKWRNSTTWKKSNFLSSRTTVQHVNDSLEERLQTKIASYL